MAGHLIGNSGDNEKQTPRALYAWLNRRYGPFDLDAFASHSNALALMYCTEDGTYERIPGRDRRPHKISAANGMIADWTDLRVFFNPPYGRGLLNRAVEHAIAERDNAVISVGLIKWDTSTELARLVRETCDVWELPRITHENDTQAATFTQALIIPRPTLRSIPTGRKSQRGK